jgi:hypothetical protein
MRAPAFLILQILFEDLDGAQVWSYNSRSARRVWLGFRSLTICLKQLVWALARAIVPEPTPTGACTPRFRLEKAHSFYVLFFV